MLDNAGKCQRIANIIDNLFRVFRTRGTVLVLFEVEAVSNGLH